MTFLPRQASKADRLVKEIDISAVDPQVKEGYELFVQQLSKDFDVVEVSIPHWEEALAAYYFIAPAEASSNLARYDGISTEL